MDDYILLIYDGHEDIAESAKEHNIILFVLPAHISHVLQPLDVWYFGPFKATYYSECSIWLGETMLGSNHKIHGL